MHYRTHSGELFLAHGVTSVRDLGNPIDWILAQRDAIALRKVPGPRIFCAGPGFFGKARRPDHMVPTTPEHGRRITRANIEQGVDFVNLYIGVPLDIARAVADEAHAAGLKVTDHLDSSILPFVDAGVDGVECYGCVRQQSGAMRVSSYHQLSSGWQNFWAMDVGRKESLYRGRRISGRESTFIEPTMFYGVPVGNVGSMGKGELIKDPGLSYIPEDLGSSGDHTYSHTAQNKQNPSEAVIANVIHLWPFRKTS